MTIDFFRAEMLENRLHLAVLGFGIWGFGDLSEGFIFLSPHVCQLARF